MGIKTTAPALRFISIIPEFLEQAEYLRELILERHDRTGITDYALCFPLHPQGDDVMAKVRMQAEVFRTLRRKLSGSPVRLGILFQSLMGHGGLWANAPGGFRVQRIVRPDGQHTIRCCPLDDVFCAYVRDAVTMLVSEGPEFLLTDDDLRLSGMMCVCPRHLAMVSERLGRSVSREELVHELETASAGSDVSRLFEEVQVESVNGLCRVIRKAIDSINPELSCGCCLVATCLDFAEPQRAILAGEHAKESFMRIGNSHYMEQAVKDMAHVQNWTGYEVANLRSKGFDLLDESDTCPHNRFSKSARTMHLHIASGIMQGLDGGKLWFDQTSCPMREISRPYEDIFGKHQGFYRELHRLAGEWKPQGGYTPEPAISREPLPHAGTIYPSLPDWITTCFSKCGLPAFYDVPGRDGTCLLSGSQTDYFTDEEITAMLSGRLILDSAAALNLTRRGFADLLGVTASRQAYSASEELSRTEGWRMVAMGGEVFLTAADGAQILSDLVYCAYTGAVETPVMPGSVYFVNARGGRVITSALNLASAHAIHLLSPARKLQYMEWMNLLDTAPVIIPDMQDVKLFCGSLPDGALIAGVFNFSYDPLPLKLVLKKKPNDIFQLMPEGDYSPLPFTWKEGTAVLQNHLEPAEVAVLKIVWGK